MWLHKQLHCVLLHYCVVVRRVMMLMITSLDLLSLPFPTLSKEVMGRPRARRVYEGHLS